MTRSKQRPIANVLGTRLAGLSAVSGVGLASSTWHEVDQRKERGMGIICWNRVTYISGWNAMPYVDILYGLTKHHGTRLERWARR